MYRILLNHDIEGQIEILKAPIDWKELTLNLTRSKTYRTINKKFITDLIFTFDTVAWIDNIFDKYGYYSEIGIEFYVWNNNIFDYEQMYIGILNYETYNRDSTSLTVDAINGSFDEKIFSKEDSIIDYSRLTDINGNNLDTEYKFRYINFDDVFGTEYTVKGAYIFDLFTKIVHTLTGKKEAFKSLVFDYNDDTETAIYKTDVITNGKYLRSEFDQGGISVSLKQLFDSLSKIYCLGMTVEYDGLRNKWLRIDPLEVFYNPQIIADCQTINELEISINNEFLYGNIKVGYNNGNSITTENAGAEYNITQNYSYNIPNSNELNLVSSIRADGTAMKLCIEETVETGKEGQYDKDLFIIKTVADVNNNLTASLTSNFVSWSGVETNPPIYMNMEICPTQILKNNQSLIMIPAVKYGNLIYSGQTTQSKLTTTLKSDEKKMSECKDIELATFNKSFLSPYKAMFTTYIDFTTAKIIMNNPHGLIRFFNYISNRIMFGWIEDMKFNFYSGKTEFTLQLASDSYYDEINMIVCNNGGLIQFSNGVNIRIGNNE